MKYIKYIIIPIISLLLMTSCIKEKPKLGRDTVGNMLKSIYYPESVEKFNKSKQYYLDNGLVTESEANSLFSLASGKEKLTQKDLERKLYIHTITHSSSNNNSDNKEIYKADYTISYDGTNSHIILLLVAQNNKIVSHSMGLDVDKK